MISIFHGLAAVVGLLTVSAAAESRATVPAVGETRLAARENAEESPGLILPAAEMAGPFGAAAAGPWIAEAVLFPVLAVVQQERYREREVLDPDSNQWVNQPISSSQPGGPVDEARSHLARGEARKAKSLLKDWVKTNRTDERYYEALFLLGEAYFERGDFYAAYEQYEQVVDNTSGDLFHKALRREMDVARAFFAGKKRRAFKIFWFPAYDDGANILGRVWERVPGTRMGEEALKLKADYRYQNGEFAVAQQEYATIAREYPFGRFTRYAMLRSAEAASEAYEGRDFEDKGLVDAEDRYRQIKTAFPEYADRENVDERLERIRVEKSERDLSVGRWYEKTRRLSSAAWYYREVISTWPDTLAATEARSRLRAMGYEVPAEAGK